MDKRYRQTAQMAIGVAYGSKTVTSMIENERWRVADRLPTYYPLIGTCAVERSTGSLRTASARSFDGPIRAGPFWA